MVLQSCLLSKYREVGICNGARGYIDSFQLAKGSSTEVENIWVVFKDENIGKQLRFDSQHLLRNHKPVNQKAVPIEVSKIRFNVGSGNVSYQRTQFPAVVAYAVTSHRSQGATLEEVIVDFTSEKGAKPYIVEGSFYVAITRATQSCDVYLEDFDMSYIKVHRNVMEKIESMRKFKAFNFKKFYLDDDIFMNRNEEIKLGYLNINDLTAEFHAEYINCDKNLVHLDILVIADSRLTGNSNIQGLQ